MNQNDESEHPKSSQQITIATLPTPILTTSLDQAYYINALAVSVLPIFEPAKPITLGELFVTLGEFFFTLGESFSLFFVYLQCNVG
jgi:hypothetical protein